MWAHRCFPPFNRRLFAAGQYDEPLLIRLLDAIPVIGKLTKKSTETSRIAQLADGSLRIVPGFELDMNQVADAISLHAEQGIARRTQWMLGFWI
jgi:hypothetical protein